MKILITGGAGYKGVKLASALLKSGHSVTILDSFLYGFDSILGLLKKPNLEIICNDIRNINKENVGGFDLIYHLAAITGYKICEINPFVARSINLDGTKKLIKVLSSSQVLVYASTTTLYGSSGKEIVETDKVLPSSVYDKTKYEAEQLVMQRKNSVALRFASLFGLSPRMRNDLMVHDFVLRAIKDKVLLLYDSEDVRTFLHVDDAIYAYILVTQLEKRMLGGVFNVGWKSMNYSKRHLAEKIRKFLDFDIDETLNPGQARRDYRIEYAKIRSLGFKAKVSLDQGIKDLIKFYSLLNLDSRLLC